MQETVKQDRDKYIGGSDIPVIMNLSPFKSRYDLLLEKAGYKDDPFKGNIYTEYGNTLEPKIRDYINKELGTNYIEGKHTREATEDEIIGVRIHTDGEDEDSILEVKTTSQIYASVDEYKIYLVQLLYYMVNTGKTRGILAVYERPEDLNEELDPERLHIYKIISDEYKDLIEDIGKALEIFIEDLQKVKDNPFITEEELLPSEIPDITKRILAFEDQLRYMKKVEAEIKSEKARLKRAMEANSVKSWTTPNGYKITLIPDGEDSIIEESFLNTDKLAQEKPDVIKEYTEIRKVEKKGRSGYIKITEPKGKEG